VARCVGRLVPSRAKVERSHAVKDRRTVGGIACGQVQSGLQRGVQVYRQPMYPFIRLWWAHPKGGLQVDQKKEAFVDAGAQLTFMPRSQSLFSCRGCTMVSPAVLLSGLRTAWQERLDFGPILARPRAQLRGGMRHLRIA